MHSESREELIQNLTRTERDSSRGGGEELITAFTHLPGPAGPAPAPLVLGGDEVRVPAPAPYLVDKTCEAPILLTTRVGARVSGAQPTFYVYP